MDWCGLWPGRWRDRFEDYERANRIRPADDQLSQSLKGIAQVHLAGIGTRIFYAQLGGFDVHGNQIATHNTLWRNVSISVKDFFDDLHEHDVGEEVIMLIFSEFGRRIRDNGNGTDHGSGGGALLIGDRINGGLYAEYPSLAPEDQLSGDMQFNNDFRSLYSTILEGWFGIAPEPIVNGNFERFDEVLAPAGA